MTAPSRPASGRIDTRPVAQTGNPDANSTTVYPDSNTEPGPVDTIPARRELSIAAIVPCYNEALAIATVVADLRAAVPTMTIYVYDNRSTDGTAEVAARAGAIVRHEDTKGKGNVVRRAFADIEADVYLLIDGDDTYDAAAAPMMIETLLIGPYDHVLGVRRQTTESAYRPGHSTGNKLFNKLVSWVFGSSVNDMLSGYRIFSRRFVKSFPAVSHEFEIEAELTVHSMSLRVPQTEVAVDFKDRPEGSVSKLNTYRDGFKILRLIFELVRHERPLAFHGVLAGIILVVALILGIPLFVEFSRTGLVPRFPTAFLAVGLVLLAALALMVGLILDGITRSRRESARLVYLGLAAPGQQIGQNRPGTDSDLGSVQSAVDRQGPTE